MLFPSKIHIPKENKGRLIEALVYPLLLVMVLWVVFLVDRFFDLKLYMYGVKPGAVEGLKGIILMPFIHGQKDYSHIINNSLPAFVLLSTLIYFYREIAFKIIISIWLGTGFMLWYIAVNKLSYHIGFSGILYGLFGFLLLSGFLINYRPLQAISLLVAFAYGSMIWGIFPTKEMISWEGHLSGLVIGLFLAIVFRNKGPKAPKYKYEIDEELLGDLEDDFEYWKQPEYKEFNGDFSDKSDKEFTDDNVRVEYHFIPKDKDTSSQNKKDF